MARGSQRATTYYDFGGSRGLYGAVILTVRNLFAKQRVGSNRCVGSSPTCAAIRFPLTEEKRTMPNEKRV